MLFYFDLVEKKLCRNILGPKNFEQNLRHRAVKAEALRMEADAI